MVEEVVEVTKDLVEFRTSKGNTEEFEDCLDYIKDYFKDADFLVREYESEDKKSLIITFEDTKTPEIMFHGHIDVVEAEDTLFEPEVRDGKIYGRGTGDMKAGVACLMKMMKELKDEKPDIALMIVSDEEIGGFNGAKHLLEEEGYKPDFAVTAEPNNVGGYLDIVVKQKGILQLELETEGKSAHSARPWKGENAADKLINIYREDIKPLFPENSEETWSSTCNLGIFNSGEAPNKVPSKASMTLDIRWSSNYSNEEVLEDIKKIQGVTVGSTSLNEPMLNTDPENGYVQDFQESVKNTAGGCEITRKEHGSDARHFSAVGIPAVVFGPEGYNSHQEGEYAVIDSFDDYIEALKDFILN